MHSAVRTMGETVSFSVVSVWWRSLVSLILFPFLFSFCRCNYFFLILVVLIPLIVRVIFLSHFLLLLFLSLSLLHFIFLSFLLFISFFILLSLSLTHRVVCSSPLLPTHPPTDRDRRTLRSECSTKNIE